MKKSIFKKLGGLFLGLAMGLGVAVGVTAGNKASEVKAEDELYSSIVFNSTNNSKSQSSYSNSWSNTTNGFTWNLVNWNNNSNGWNYIKAGHKTNAYTATAITGAKVPVKISKIKVDCSWSNASVTSVKLYMGSSATSFTTTIATLTSGAKDYTISNPVVDQFYKLEVVCNKGANGMFQLNNIELYEQKASALPLSISGDSTVYNGKTITLSASSNGTAVTGVTWSSSNTGVATVDSSSGVVTGVNGTTSGASVTITAKKDGYEDATKTITVKADTKTLKSISASVSVEHSTFTLGDSFTTESLVVKGTYSHTNGDADSQEEITDGITTSPVVGTTLNTVGPQTVTVNAGGKSTTYSINVNYAAVESVKLDYNEGTLGKGGEATLPGVTIEPANANQGYSWGNPVATEGIVYTYDPSTHELVIGANNAVEGTIQFTATATGDSSKTATVVYTVQAAQIANITGVTASATGDIVAKQYVGDAFNAQGFSFAPTWSEGDHDVVEITASDISWNALVAGSNPTGTYSCADGDFTVTITGVTVVNDTLVSIAFAEGCDMTKKSYSVGDSWDFSGLSIVGTMDSGKTAPAIASSNVTFSSNDAVATTTTSITVTASYQGLTTAKTITGIEVKVVTMTSLTVNYTGGQPVLGTDFVFAGTIKGNMSNGTQQDVSVSDVDFEVNKFINTQQTVTVTHKTTGATGTFNVTYKNASYTTTTEATHSYSYDKVTSSQTDWRGKYLIVYETGKLAFDGSLATLDAVSNTKSVTISNNSITTDADGKINGNAIYFTVAYKTGSTSVYSLKSASGNYISGTTTSATASNGLKQAATDSNYEISFNGTTLQSKSSNQQMVLKYNKNSGQTRFRFYKSGQEEVALYKFTDHVTPGQTIPSDEKHAIRIADVTCSKSPLIAGETISKSDFKIQVQYDTGTALTSNLVPTSVSPATLVAGTNDYTITYTGSYNDTVTKVIQLTAQAPAVLESISITKDAGCDDVFTRMDTFTHNGIHVIAHYTDSTTYPDADVTANADITPPSDMNVAGTKTINVSYEENGDTKTTSYQITVNPIVSTYLTLSGEGIEGSNGVYTLKSGVVNEVQLSLDKDGDEEIEVTNPTTFLTFDKASSKLTINSQTTSNESGTITFTAGSVTASLTVTVSAAEGIQNLGDEEIIAYVGSSFSYDINIKLNNVESATWTLPEGDFVIESETEDNTGFVGTIYFTDEVLDTLTFSAVTGKGKTLSVEIEVLAVNDNIKSISASLKSGVTYTAGQGQTFSKDDLTVTFVRDSGARGTLASNEFTVSGLPEGSFNRVTSYDLTITSVENTEATDSLTINVGMPKDKLGNDLNIVTKTSVHHDGTISTSWDLLTNKSQLSSTEKIYLYESEKGYVTGYNSSDATVSTTASERIEFSIEIVDTTNGTFKLKNTTTDKYISSNGSNKFTIAASQDNAAVFNISSDTDGLIYYTNSGNRALAINSSYIRCYTTGNSNYTYFSAYISKHTQSDPWDEPKYNDNAMTATIYNFIAKANEVYADICGSEGNNQKPDLTTWRSVLESDEYEKLVADSYSYNLLKSAICGEGAYGPDGVYAASGDKQSSDMVIEFLQKYDRVVSNYSSENYNYLGRDVASSSPRINPILALNEVDNSVWVISAVALVGLAAVGGYFFYRKRKEI